jgi:hypothetical protein
VDENTSQQSIESSQPLRGSSPVTVLGPFLGQYANFIQIGATDWEFVLDFGLLESTEISLQRPQPGPRSVAATLRPVARVILSPQNVKGFLGTLEETISKYEQQHGITLPDLRSQEARGEQPSQVSPRNSSHKRKRS